MLMYFDAITSFDFFPSFLMQFKVDIDDSETVDDYAHKLMDEDKTHVVMCPNRLQIERLTLNVK